MKIAVIGATGTAGARTTSQLKATGADVVEVSRTAGVDLISGDGLRGALDGVDVVIDTSNAFPSDDSIDLHDALTAATRHVVEACSSQRVARLVFLSICGIENPVFDDFPYYAAKRAQERIVNDSPVPSTIV
ncbi:MAG: SDR family oxidoreductase, partial [Acidimicrobiales bacterium]